MVAKKDPAFLFYCTTWLHSDEVNTLSLEQQGAYVRLLCFAWLHGSIPEDREDLQQLLGLGTDDAAFGRIWRKLGKLWSVMPGTPGRLINERQEQERSRRLEHAEEMRRRGAAGGKQSAEQRSKQGSNRSPSRAQADVAAETELSSSSTSSTVGRQAGEPSYREPKFDGSRTAVPGFVTAAVDAVAARTRGGSARG